MPMEILADLNSVLGEVIAASGYEREINTALQAGASVKNTRSQLSARWRIWWSMLPLWQRLD